MAGTDGFNLDTLALHAGQSPDSQFGARATPIYLSTSFVFKDSDQAAALFNMAVFPAPVRLTESGYPPTRRRRKSGPSPEW